MTRVFFFNGSLDCIGKFSVGDSVATAWPNLARACVFAKIVCNRFQTDRSMCLGSLVI